MTIRTPVTLATARPQFPGLYWVSNGGAPKLVEWIDNRKIFMEVHPNPIAPDTTPSTRWLKYQIGDEREVIDRIFG